MMYQVKQKLNPYIISDEMDLVEALVIDIYQDTDMTFGDYSNA